MTLSSWACLLVCLAGTVVCAGCGNGTEQAPGNANLAIVSGFDQADTIGAPLPEPLVVAVRDSFDRPAADVAVDWGTAGECPPGCTVLVSSDSGGAAGQTLRTMTGTDGQARVWIQLGRFVGPGTLTISVPDLDLSGTAEFLVRAGRPHRIELDPADVAVTLGSVGQFSVVLTDHGDNPVSAPVSYTPETPGIVEIDSAGAIGSLAFGRTAVTVRADGIATTGSASVVPAGTLAIAIDEGEVSVLTTTGSDRLRIPMLDGQGQQLKVVALAWSPDGSALALEISSGGGVSSLYTAPLNGALSLLVRSSADDSSAHYPRWSRDGEWIYYQITNAAFAGEIWRSRPDGSGVERVGAQASGSESDYEPDPSPDGSEVVYMTTRGGDPEFPVLTVRNLVTDADRTLVPGRRPRWSPDGQWIAYLRDFTEAGYGAVWLVRPDGSDAHALTASGLYYDDALDWSPDGHWLVGTGGPDVTLVQVSSGLVLPIGTLGNLNAAAWRP